MLKCLLPGLVLLAAPIYSQQCGYWTFTTFPQAGLMSTVFCHIAIPGAEPPPTLSPTTQSYTSNCDAGGDMIRTEYSTTDCTGAPLQSNNVSATIAPFRCGVACGRNIGQYQSNQACANLLADFNAASAAPDACVNGQVVYCDTNNLITQHFGTNDQNCQNLQSAAGRLTIEPFGKCVNDQISSNCQIPPNITTIPLTFGINQIVVTETNGTTCNGAPSLTETARIGGLCADPKTLGLRQYCGTSGGSVWQYYTQNGTDGTREGCGPELTGVMFVNTGNCTGDVYRQPMFNPINPDLSQTYTCTADAGGNPPMIDFGSNQYAKVRVFRPTSGMCLDSEFLYDAYVRADGICAGGSPYSYRRWCNPDGSLLTAEYQNPPIYGCTGANVANYTWNSSCSSWASGILVGSNPFGKVDVMAIVDFCGTGANPLDPITLPGVRNIVTGSPSMSPSTTPSKSPSMTPSTTSPSTSPSRTPTTTGPSQSPTNSPSGSPTNSPTKGPSGSPTAQPSVNPTRNPSMMPSKSPSMTPSKAPSFNPSTAPSTSGPSTSGPSTSGPTTSAPSTAGPSTSGPTTSAPSTSAPSHGPSKTPSQSPSTNPSKKPSGSPSMPPTPVSKAATVGGAWGSVVVAAAVAIVCAFVVQGAF